MSVVPQEETAEVVRGHLPRPTSEHNHQEYFWMGNSVTEVEIVCKTFLRVSGLVFASSQLFPRNTKYLCLFLLLEPLNLTDTQ